MAKEISTVDTVVNLCKRRGFVFPCGEIYGGTRSAWDYGPLGVELKENIKRQWWRAMVTSRDDIVGLDSSIILPPQVWRASGHVDAFVDPLVECLSCHKRFRLDHLQEAVAEKEAKKGKEIDPDSVEPATIACPNCGTRGQWTEPREFNGLLRTHLGVVDDESGLHYLRPETAQGIFVNYLNVMNAARMKPPFGIAQTGKSFRNEITPGNFIFRTREFE
ncbi:glycine--tRNA ligase, partial [Nostocoides australiense]|nr:glycine--tRNA ligase [Tetrasphaera australiensis]